MTRIRQASLLLVIALPLAGCGRGRMAGAHDTAQEQSRPGLVRLTDEQMVHIRVTPVRRTSWSITVRTTGTVDWDADHTSPAITQVSGPISRIVVDLGSSVPRGGPLLFVPSPDVSGALAGYRKAANRLELARRSLERSRDLLDHQAIARKDLEAAQADYNDALTDVDNALQTLKIMGITKEQIEGADRQGAPIDPETTVRSPIAGVVVQKMVSPGQLIQAGNTTCFLISDVSTVWVQGHIHEKDLASIRVGDRVEETNPSFTEVFQGVVSYIGAMVDSATRTTPVRVVTRNPGGKLKKDMVMDVVIHTRTRTNVLAVPSSAVLRDADNQPFVYLEDGRGAFARREVTLGAQLDDQAEILSGCKEGDRVVSEGSVFLQSAGGNQ
ncbi:MAG: efflux RND transporter periplasmic adaptor subunit [Bryobacteraceae bacterium]